MRKSISTTLVLGLALLAQRGFAAQHEYLIKLSSADSQFANAFVEQHGGSLTLVSRAGKLFKWTTSQRVQTQNFANRNLDVEYIHDNFTIKLRPNPSIEKAKPEIAQLLSEGRLTLDNRGAAYPDNPEIQGPTSQAAGADPKIADSWGLSKVNAKQAWNHGKGEGIVVAVTDTGVDYNHEDLVNNMWRNPDEIAGDGIDNDQNGYIDDIVGWDFFSNDNKPYDLSMELFDILLSGGNPGHGTHCAGVIGASANNAKGSAGVAPNVKLMALRFIGENGQGKAEDAVKMIDYAVENGAQIISASWGSEGEELGDDALRDAVTRAEQAGVLMIIAAGNGRVDQASMSAKGYNNDTDPKPVFPATYPNDNIIAVAATDVDENIAVFSNFGKKTVDLGAPGVKVLSTVPGNRYQDTIINMGSFLNVTWDGTSMATPHVAGAAAVIWSMDPQQDWKSVKEKLLSSTTSIASLQGKVATDGRLDLKDLRLH